MGDMLRSDPMTYCDIFLQPEAAFEILSHLGEMGRVQFIDMNPEVQAFQRRYISEVCRCAEMERRLRFMEKEMQKDKLNMPDPIMEPAALHPNEMVMYENIFEKWEEDIIEMAGYQTSLMTSYLEITEMYYVLRHIGPILGDAEIVGETLFTENNKGHISLGTGGHLFVMTGVVQRSKCFHFEMMLWRISRGNIYYRQAAKDKILLDPHTGKEIRKVAFLAVCQGQQLSKRMEKVFSGFRVNVYQCPQTNPERTELMLKIKNRLNDLEEVLKNTNYHRCKTLRTVGRQWRGWMIQTQKAKAIFHTMNLFTLDITKNCLIGQCWVPDKDLRYVQDTLEFCSRVIDTNVPSFLSKTHTDSVPPTFHRTNKFTHGFQALINAYGDSRYGELNPGLYTIITFPFLFSIMFGDVGHASLMTIFALWMLKNEKRFMSQKSTNEIWNIFFSGRYVILMLGLFSIFTGVVYNDIFSKTMFIADSYFSIPNITLEQVEREEQISLNPNAKYGHPYVIGIDPLWGVSTNRIMTDNSVKMKMSIIIGVIHMIFGILLSFFNDMHFKTYHLIFLQFIPELLFLCCIFLWLVVLIFYKWFTYSHHHPDIKYGAGCAPQVLILFIDMVLLSETKALDQNCDAYMFDGQKDIQTVLVVVAIICVPVLLFGTPIYVHMRNKKKMKMSEVKPSNFRRYRDDSDAKEAVAPPPEKHDSFSDLMIYQGVHTIEFALSTISHTASYLRLWALSLAHGQLSDMLWSMILSKLALQDHSNMGILKLFIMFAIWATFSLCILVVMEGLSAFLHTLRLHWVEFMSKFYHGGGYVFHPFSFKVMLAQGDKAENICRTRADKEETI